MAEYVCEVCDRTEQLTEEAAFDAGWDYPPFIGAWGVVSPRTCPDCTMTMTAWWALTQGVELTDRHQATVARIQAEAPRG